MRGRFECSYLKVDLRVTSAKSSDVVYWTSMKKRMGESRNSVCLPTHENVCNVRVEVTINFANISQIKLQKKWR